MKYLSLILTTLVTLSSAIAGPQFSWPAQINSRTPYETYGAKPGLYSFMTETMVNFGTVVLFVEKDETSVQKLFADLKVSLVLDGFRPGSSEMKATVTYVSEGFKDILIAPSNTLQVKLGLKIDSCLGDLPDLNAGSADQLLRDYLSEAALSPVDLASCKVSMTSVSHAGLSRHKLTTHAKLLTTNGFNNLVSILEMKSYGLKIDIADEKTIRLQALLYRPDTRSAYTTALWGSSFQIKSSEIDQGKVDEVENAYVEFMTAIQDYLDELSLTASSPEPSARLVRLEAYLQAHGADIRDPLKVIRDNYYALPPLSQAFILRSVDRVVRQITSIDRAIGGQSPIEKIIRSDK